MKKRTNGHDNQIMIDPGYAKYDLTNPDNYEADYEFPYSDKIQKIYEIPDIKDMPGVFIRGIFKDKRELNAHLRLHYRHMKFGNILQEELLRCKIGGSAAIGGVGRAEAFQTAVNLIAPEIYRIARGMPKYKSKNDQDEPVHHSSEFRYPKNENGVISH